VRDVARVDFATGSDELRDPCLSRPGSCTR